MSVTFYFDENANGSIVDGLRLRSVDLLTVVEDGRSSMADPDVLARATALGRVLFSQDKDLLAEATARQIQGKFFGGLIYAHQKKVGIGTCVRDLELIAKAMEPEDLTHRVEYLPL